MMNFRVAQESDLAFMYLVYLALEYEPRNVPNPSFFLLNVPAKPYESMSPSAEPLVLLSVQNSALDMLTAMSVEKFAQELDRAYQAEHRVVSPPPGTLLHTYQVPQEGAYAFSWTLNRLRIASGDTGGRIEVCDIATGNVVSLNRGHNIFSYHFPRLAFAERK